MLGIERSRLGLVDAEEVGVEARDIVKERSPFGD
jgi:hypothetical protein